MYSLKLQKAGSSKLEPPAPLSSSVSRAMFSGGSWGDCCLTSLLLVAPNATWLVAASIWSSRLMPSTFCLHIATLGGMGMHKAHLFLGTPIIAFGDNLDNLKSFSPFTIFNPTLSAKSLSPKITITFFILVPPRGSNPEPCTC